jgi:hypothetical protein
MPDDTFRPIDRLSAEWERTGRSREGREALRALAAAEEVVARLGAGDLAGLVAALRRARGRRGREEAARVLQAMLRSQDVHPLVPRAILQALLPGLINVARRLSWGRGGDWSDGGAFFADVVATAWEVIAAWSGEDRDYAVLDLLSAVRCRVRRQLVGQRTARERLVLGLADDDRLLCRPCPGATDLDRLAWAIEEMSGRGLDPADAAVLYGNRVLGLSIAELTRLSGKTRRQLECRRERAQGALCA